MLEYLLRRAIQYKCKSGVHKYLRGTGEKDETAEGEVVEEVQARIECGGASRELRRGRLREGTRGIRAAVVG